ncbi:sulfate permease [Achromatium sp. WMS3]|nr:sulfate permease [Achromatium sp. WMS3]
MVISELRPLFFNMIAQLYTLFTPFRLWLPQVNKNTLQADIIAGITGAIIVLPQGVAFAMIAGMPPEYGLYTAIIPAIVAAMLGSSHHLISGPTTAISIVVFSTLSPIAKPGSMDFVQLAFTLTLIAGIFQMILGLARLGTLINFVSHTVVVGFTAGAALLIAAKQMKNFFGIPVPDGASFLEIWIAVIEQISQVNLYVMAVAIITLGVAVGFKIYQPKWPGMLIAMIVGSICAVWFGAEAHGIKLVGELPAQLPPLSLPKVDLSAEHWHSLVSGGLAVAMLGLVEAVSIARSVASRSQQRIDGNQEFIGQGMANVIGAFFSSYASSGSFTRTGVNYTAGAKTPMAAVFAALSLALILLLIAPLTAYLPIPAMAGILLLVAYNLIDFKHIQKIIQSGNTERAVLFTTFFSTLFLDLEFSIYVGVMLSLGLYLRRTSRPSIITLAPDWDEISHPLTNTAKKPLTECPQVRIIRLDGSLFFGSIAQMGEFFTQHSKERPEQNHLLLIGNAMNFIDLAGVEFLEQEAHRSKITGGGLYLANFKTKVAQEARDLGLMQHVEHFDHKSEGIQKIFIGLNRDICRKCSKRIFFECESIPQEAGVAK